LREQYVAKLRAVLLEELYSPFATAHEKPRRSTAGAHKPGIKPTKANPYAESAAGRGQWQAI